MRQSHCARCGTAFTARRSTARYCSATCRAAAWKLAHRRPASGRREIKLIRIVKALRRLAAELESLVGEGLGR